MLCKSRQDLDTLFRADRRAHHSCLPLPVDGRPRGFQLCTTCTREPCGYRRSGRLRFVRGIDAVRFQLGQKLGVGIVAEGVETPEQAGFLRGLGCPVAQGYLYAKPMPLGELMGWLQARSALPAD